MQPGHEDCMRIADGTVALPFRCAHDHKAPIVIAADLRSPETVGWHCHCCSRVWIDQTYVEGATQ